MLTALSSILKRELTMIDLGLKKIDSPSSEGVIILIAIPMKNSNKYSEHSLEEFINLEISTRIICK